MTNQVLTSRPRQFASHPRPSVTPTPNEKQKTEQFVPEFAREIPYGDFGIFPDNPELDEEFDIDNLGIDFSVDENLLPWVYYVGSDDPMLKYGRFKIPKSYPKERERTNEIDRLSRFSDNLLLFMFYVHGKSGSGDLRNQVYKELVKRRYSFDESRRIWMNSNRQAFDVEKWMFVDLDQTGHMPIKIPI